MLTPGQVKLLRAAKREILKRPSQFAMSVFFGTGGTTACIGGWMVALSESKSLAEASASSMGDIEDRAAHLIGTYGGSQRANSLFHLSCWPDPFWNNYREAKTMTERAKIAAARIEQFISDFSGDR